MAARKDLNIWHLKRMQGMVKRELQKKWWRLYAEKWFGDTVPYESTDSFIGSSQDFSDYLKHGEEVALSTSSSEHKSKFIFSEPCKATPVIIDPPFHSASMTPDKVPTALSPSKTELRNSLAAIQSKTSDIFRTSVSYLSETESSVDWEDRSSSLEEEEETQFSVDALTATYRSSKKMDLEKKKMVDSSVKKERVRDKEKIFSVPKGLQLEESCSGLTNSSPHIRICSTLFVDDAAKLSVGRLGNQSRSPAPSHELLLSRREDKRLKDVREKHTKAKKSKLKEHGARQQVKWDDAKQKRHMYIMKKWSDLCKLVAAFLNCVRNDQERKKFERFLRTRAGIGVQDVAGAITRKGLKDASLVKGLKDTSFVYRQLPNCLKFWKQVDKYRQEMMDCLVRPTKPHAEAIPTADYDQAYFNRRAAAIIELFLQSDIGVRCQIDFPDCDGAKIASAFKIEGASVSLFHTPFLRLFPILFNSWKQYRDAGARFLPTFKTSEVLSPNTGMIGDIPHPGCPIPVVDKHVPVEVIPVWIDPAVLPSNDPVLTQPESPRLATVPIMHRPPKGSPDLASVGKLEKNEQRIEFSLLSGTYIYLPLAHEQQKRREEERLAIKRSKEEANQIKKGRTENAHLEKLENKFLSEKIDANLRVKLTEDGGDGVKGLQKSTTIFGAFKSTGEHKPTKPIEPVTHSGQVAASRTQLRKHSSVAASLAPSVPEGMALQDVNTIKPLEMNNKSKKRCPAVQDYKQTKLPFLPEQSIPLFPQHLQLPPFQEELSQPSTAELNKAFVIDKSIVAHHPVAEVWYERCMMGRKCLKTEKLPARKTYSQVQPFDDPRLPKSRSGVMKLKEAEAKPKVLGIADPAVLLVIKGSKPKEPPPKRISIPSHWKNAPPAIKAVAGKLYRWTERSKKSVRERKQIKYKANIRTSMIENRIKRISITRAQGVQKASDKKLREIKLKGASLANLRGGSSSTKKESWSTSLPSRLPGHEGRTHDVPSTLAQPHCASSALQPVKSSQLEIDTDTCAEKVSALVEKLHLTRQLVHSKETAENRRHPGDSLEAVAVASAISQLYQDFPLYIEPATSQVFGSAGRGKPPITSAMFAFKNSRPRAALATPSVQSLASEATASRASDTFSQKIRRFTYKDGNPQVTRGRVTTPDISETQKRNKKKKEQTVWD